MPHSPATLALPDTLVATVASAYRGAGPLIVQLPGQSVYTVVTLSQINRRGSQLYACANDKVLIKRMGNQWVMQGIVEGKQVLTESAPPTWKPMSLVDGRASAYDAGTTHGIPEFMFDKRTGFVHLRGAVKIDPSAYGSAVFFGALDGNCTPAKNVSFVVPHSTNTDGAAIVYVDITGAVWSNYGDVQAQNFISLEGIMFPANELTPLAGAAVIGAAGSWRSASPILTYNYSLDDVGYECGAFTHPAGYLLTTGRLAGTVTTNTVVRFDSQYCKSHKNHMFPSLRYNSGTTTWAHSRWDMNPGELQFAAGGSNDSSWIGGFRVHDISTRGSWTAPTMSNSWVNFQTGGDYRWDTAQWRKDRFGFVHLRGLIKSGTTTTGTNIIASGQLPPPQNGKNAIFCAVDAAVLGARLRITAAGALQVVYCGNNAYLSLDSVMYYAGGSADPSPDLWDTGVWDGPERWS